LVIALILDNQTPIRLTFEKLISMTQSNFGQAKIGCRSSVVEIHHSSDHIKIGKSLPQNSAILMVRIYKKNMDLSILNLCSTKAAGG